MAIRSIKKLKATDEPVLLIPTTPPSLAELNDKIAARAYELYLARNGSAGDATSDWLIAEHEIYSALNASMPQTDNIVSITSVATKRKKASTTIPTTRRSSTPKTASQSRTRKQKEAKE